jgi:hypothetical protein
VPRSLESEWLKRFSSRKARTSFRTWSHHCFVRWDTTRRLLLLRVDAGVGIIAYRDPLGTVSPRVTVQIKHREADATVHEIRQLMGPLQKDGGIGMFVSSGGFTANARSTARSSHVHVELLDLDRFIECGRGCTPNWLTKIRTAFLSSGYTCTHHSSKNE